jgi:hypothetical protein
MLPKTSKCKECANLVSRFCAKRKTGRAYVHPGKPRRCPWFARKSA